MDNKEAIEELKCLREDYWEDDGYGHETKEYEDTISALDKAIASLEAWDKIIENINTKYWHILKATKYGNEDAEQQSFSYSNVLMYEVSDILNDIEEIKKEG